MDRISIKGLEVFAHHGVNKEEQKLGQKFLVSVDMFLDTRTAGLSDALSGSIDYSKVCSFINRFMTHNTYKLIEAAAEYLARALLLKFKPQLQEVSVTIKKPWAPIGYPLDTTEVCIHRKWHTAYLSLGSNMGDRKKYIKDAISAISAHKLCRVTKTSSIIETEPYGNVDQDAFLNAAIEVKTLLSPVELLSLGNDIEKSADRVRTEHWGPRTLDIDVIFYDDEIINLKSPALYIPHKDMQNRDFVLAPLNEIVPGFIHPIYNKSMRVMYEELKG